MRYFVIGQGSDEKAGLMLMHYHGDETDENLCVGSAFFDTPAVREKFPNRGKWTVESWEPLTISPSLLIQPCGFHGFIREGRWVGV